MEQGFAISLYMLTGIVIFGICLAIFFGYVAPNSQDNIDRTVDLVEVVQTSQMDDFKLVIGE